MAVAHDARRVLVGRGGGGDSEADSVTGRAGERQGAGGDAPSGLE
jgi:hypothetical protein